MNYKLKTFWIYNNEFLFFFAWILFLLSLLLQLTAFSVDNDTISKFLKLLRYCAYALFCLKIILYTKIKEYKYLSLILMCSCILASFVNTYNATMPLYLLILLASIKIDSDKLIKITALLQGVVLAVVVGFSQVGILKDFVFEPLTRGRHSLGFSWTTTGPILFFYFSLCIIYITRNSTRIWFIILLEIINLLFFILTNSRLTFVLLSAFLFFVIIQKFNKRKWKFLSKFKYMYIVFPFFMETISVIIVMLYDASSPIWISINRLLSNRLRLGRDALNTYGLGIFGRNVEWIGFSITKPTSELASGYNYVDSSYLQLSINFGLIFMIAVLIIYSYAIYKAIKIKDYYLLTIFICILIFSFTEPRLFNFAFNPFPILAFSKIRKKPLSYRKRERNIL